MTQEEEQVLSNIIYLNNKLCGNVLSSLGGKNNIIVSPPILHSLLLVLSQDKTYVNRSNFNWVLCINNKNDLYVKCYKDFISSFPLFSNETFSLANKLYLKDNQKLQDDFNNTVNNFHYKTDIVDFDQKDTSVKLIDSWIRNKTNGLVTNLITNDSLNDDTLLGMVNTIHFKAKWDGTFNLKSSPGKFHLNENDTIETQMMKMTGEVYYKFDDYMSVATIELPLASNEFSLIVLLPDKGSNIEEEMNLCWHLPQSTSNMEKKLVEISLPRFKMEQLINCKNILANVSILKYNLW